MQEWIALFFDWNGSTATIGIGTIIAALVVWLKFYKDRVGKPVYTLVLLHDLWKVTALALSISITLIIAPKVILAANSAVSAATNASAAKNSAESAQAAVVELTDVLRRSFDLDSPYAELNRQIKELEDERTDLEEKVSRLEGMLTTLEGPLEPFLFEVANYAAEFSRGSIERGELFQGLLDAYRGRSWPLRNP